MMVSSVPPQAMSQTSARKHKMQMRRTDTQDGRGCRRLLVYLPRPAKSGQVWSCGLYMVSSSDFLRGRRLQIQTHDRGHRRTRTQREYEGAQHNAGSLELRRQLFHDLLLVVNAFFSEEVVHLFHNLPPQWLVHTLRRHERLQRLDMLLCNKMRGMR